MLVSELRLLVTDIWGSVYINNKPITDIIVNKVVTSGKEPLFGDEVLEILENYSDDCNLEIQ